MSNSRSGKQPRRFKRLLAGLLWPTGALVILCIACDSSSNGDDFGPLAVMDALGGADGLAGTGPVRIDEDCVTMTTTTGAQVLLVWHVTEVAWDPESRTISYTSFGNRNDETVTIRDGDIISVGGRSLVGDVPVERNLPWLATPHPTCPGHPWAVFGVFKEAFAPRP